jgi:hypothetical protein
VSVAEWPSASDEASPWDSVSDEVSRWGSVWDEVSPSDSVSGAELQSAPAWALGEASRSALAWGAGWP